MVAEQRQRQLAGGLPSSGGGSIDLMTAAEAYLFSMDVTSGEEAAVPVRV